MKFKHNKYKKGKKKKMYPKNKNIPKSWCNRYMIILNFSMKHRIIIGKIKLIYEHHVLCILCNIINMKAIKLGRYSHSFL